MTKKYLELISTQKDSLAMIPKFYKIDRAFIHMKYSYAIYLSNISILFFLYQTEVQSEHSMIEVRISDVLRRLKKFNLKH